jgi:hypothetical protein
MAWTDVCSERASAVCKAEERILATLPELNEEQQKKGHRPLRLRRQARKFIQGRGLSFTERARVKAIIAARATA